MDMPALMAHALSAVDGNQAELARRLGRSETTVSRWVAGRNGLDYESALRLARIVDLPPQTVLEAAQLDPTLLPPSASEPSHHAEVLRLRTLLSDLQQLLSGFSGNPSDGKDATADYIYQKQNGSSSISTRLGAVFAAPSMA